MMKIVSTQYQTYSTSILPKETSPFRLIWMGALGSPGGQSQPPKEESLDVDIEVDI